MRFFYKNELIDLDSPPSEIANESWYLDIKAAYRNWQNGDNLTLTTSGSTGAPKTISHSRASTIHSAELTIEHFGLRAGSRALLCLPAAYIAGRMMIIRGILGDWDMHLVPPSVSPLESLDVSLDFAAMTPMQLGRSLDDHPERAAQIDQIILGGGPVSMALQQRISALPSSIYHTYGMTETITHIAIRELSGTSPSDRFTTLPGVTLSISDECLVISADHLGSSPIITTDSVDLLSPTEFVWRGRIDHIINSGGLKINPLDVESQIGEITSIADYFITGREDDTLGQRVVLVTDVAECYHAQILLKINKIQDRKHRPKEIIFVKKVKKTPTGKIIRSLDHYDNIRNTKSC